jgi:hypothetical protein
VDLLSLDVHVPPGKPKRFAAAKPEHEDQHKGRVQRVAVPACGLKGAARRPTLDPAR